MATRALAFNGTRAKAPSNSSAVPLTVPADPPPPAGAAGFFAPQAGRIPPGSQALIVVLALFVPIILFGVFFALVARRRKRPVIFDDILEQADGVRRKPGSSAAYGSSSISKPQRPRTSWGELLFGRWSFKQENGDHGAASIGDKTRSRLAWDGRTQRPPDEEEPEWKSQYPKIIRPQQSRLNGSDHAATSNEWSEEVYPPESCTPSYASCTPRSDGIASEPPRAVAVTAEASTRSQSSLIPPPYPLSRSQKGVDAPSSHGVLSSSAAAAGLTGSSSLSSTPNQPLSVPRTPTKPSHPPSEACKAGGKSKEQLQEIEPESLCEVESWRSCISYDSSDPQQYQNKAAAPLSTTDQNGHHQIQLHTPSAVAGHAPGTTIGPVVTVAGSNKGMSRAKHVSGEGLSGGSGSSMAAAAAAGAKGPAFSVGDVHPLPTPFAAAAGQPFERKRSYRSHHQY